MYSGRSCDPRGGPHACVITAHDAATGEELWRTRLIPGPGEPGDETWGDVPFEERGHVGSWMVPSVDPELNLVYVGTSVTSPAPKFMLGGADLTHLYHNSTLALHGDTGEIVWHYQHMNDHWDLDHPFERLLVDTSVRPNAAAVSWINPRIEPGEERRVLTGIPGKTGIVYTLDRETGEFLWATPTITQNVVSGIDGAGDRLLSTRQTALVVDPPDGRVPVKAWAAADREERLARQRDDYRAMSTWDRCITRGVPGSMLPTGYNNAYRILQTPGLVVILHEMIHEARIVPVTDRAHIDGDVELWTGDARARWEGDTLVVDTTNFNDRAMIVTSSNGGRLKGLPVGDSMHVVERFTRVSRDEILWEVTIEDPDVYDRPWTISMPLTRAPGYEMYEYACHEGNQDVAIYLGGGRVEDAGR